MKKFALLICISALSGCYIDNQKVVSEVDYSVANPVPTARNFAAQNAAHKVIMGVIDTGVDYNHPLLAANMHFELDTQGRPIRLGKDYVGDDGFPAPYVVRTSAYDPALTDADRSKSLKNAGFMNELIQMFPSLAPYLEPRRNVAQESSEGAYHGTHVAGLMTYDRPDFGLKAYRILPTNKAASEDHDYTLESIMLIVKAVDLAAADGAKIVNMSIGMNFEKALKPEDIDSKAEEFAKMKEYFEAIAAAVKRHPDVLYVAAAGNEGTWADSANRFGMPCGVKAPNMLCVGALRENGDPAQFTNIPISGADVVFTLGYKVLSTVPTSMCTASEMESLAGLDDDTSLGDKTSLAKTLNTKCLTTPGMAYLSGTSMASPLVAHMAGAILASNPALNPQGIIQALYQQAIPSFIGTVPVYKLRIVKPSWYTSSSSSIKSSGAAPAPEYFEGYMPVSFGNGGSGK